MGQIEQIIRSEIERQGPIPFCRFMEICLYQPGCGYYERTSIGRESDFYTSASIGPVFGELLAFQFAQWAQAWPDESLRWVEAGAHDGTFALDFLAKLHSAYPQTFRRLEYCLIEPSAARQGWQRQKLEEFADRVRWCTTLADLPPSSVAGVIFSNELLDSFPLRRAGWSARAHSWFEWGVTLCGDQFAWARLPGRGVEHELEAAGFLLPPELLPVLPDDFTIDFSPEWSRWWQHAASRIRKGRLITFDYGLATEDFLTPARAEGTLRAYTRHHSTKDVLANAGSQDLTAHINFTALQAAGEAAGLRTEFWTRQGQFLSAIATEAARAGDVFEAWTPARARQFHALAHPEHLGESFKVLVQSRP